MDINFYAKYSNIIGPLAKFVKASNSFKTFLRYFGKVWRKSNVCIIRFYWLIALYIFISLVPNASFLIVKNSSGREEVSDVNKSLCRNIFLVSLCLCTSPLVRVPPQLNPPPFNYHPSNGPGMCAADNYQRLRFSNSRSPDKFTGKRKTQIIIYVYIYIAHHLRGQWHSSISWKVLTCHQ